MRNRKVRRRFRKRINIHNDLGNAAHYFKQTIEAKLATKNEDGIALDCLAGLVMLAFAFEAQINFLGDRLIKGWNERRPFHKKVNQIYSHFDITPHTTERPYKTIECLKLFRDQLAHGKPAVVHVDDIVTMEEAEQSFDLSAEWEEYCNETFFREAYQDVNSHWKELLKRANIEPFDTLTGGVGSYSIFESSDD